MYSIIIDDLVRYKIDLFLKGYLETSLNNFFDSGLFNEKIIINAYKDIAKGYRDDIYFEIEKTFSEEFIIKKIGEDGKISSYFSVGNFRFVIYFIENKEEKLRILNDIKFFKK